MRGGWKQLLARFDALTRRERMLVAVALVGGLLMVGNTLLIDLPLARAGALGKQLLAEEGELQSLQAQMTSLQREIRNPDDDNRARLAALRQQMQDMRGALAEHERLLVAPQAIPGLLEQLLAGHSTLRLVSLRTLPTQVASQPEGAEGDADKAAGKEARPAPAPLDIWKHGVEIRLQGSYADLAAYLAELEHLPQRLVWGEVRFKAEYPRNELHLKIYTYSLDPAWLSL